MASKGLAGLAAVGDGRVRTEDLTNRTKLRTTLRTLLGSAATTDISQDKLQNSVWNWKTDRRTGHVFPDYGIPTSYDELVSMVQEKRLNGREGVEYSEDGYLTYLTSGAYKLSTRNWVTHRNPLATSEEQKKEGERKSSEFFEKRSSNKKTTADLYREAARMARDTMLLALAGEEDEIVTLRISVEKGSSHSLEHFLATATLEDGTETIDGTRKMMATVESLRRLTRLDPSKLSVERIAMSYLEEFQLNLTSKDKEADGTVDSKNILGEQITGKKDETESHILTRLAMAFALIRVKDDVIRKTEHEFNAKTQLSSTPANFRDNTAIYVTTVNREIAKLPKAQRVKIVADSAPQQLQNNEPVETVAKVQNGNFKKKGFKGDKKKTDNDQNSEKDAKHGKAPCPYCQIRTGGKLFYHKIEECQSRKKNKDVIMEKINEDLGTQGVKSIRTSRNDFGRNGQDYDIFGGFNE